MIQKVLAGLGVLVLLGAAGFAVFGFVVLKDRVRVVVQPDAATTQPDGTALLRDEVKQLAADVQALASATAENFTRLQAAADAAAAERHAELLKALQPLQQLNANLDRSAQRLGALEQSLQGIQGSITALAAAPKPGTEVAMPVAPTEEPKPVAVPEEPAPAPVPVAPQAKPVSGGFLTFAVPQSSFRFDAQQEYVLLPELSRVGFDAKSTLHDFSGVTSQIEGRFQANLADPAGAWTGSVSCKAATLKTGVDGRDTNMYEHLDSAHHGEIRYELLQFVPDASGIDAVKQTAKGTIAGKMTIRGQTRDLRMPVTISVDASKRVVIEGQTPLKLGDYGVPVPSQLGLINMQDEVKVWVALRARAKAGR